MGIPMIAWATQNVSPCASVTSRRAFAGGSGNRSSAEKYTAMHKSVEVGVHRGLHVGDAGSTADFGLLCTKRLAHGDRRESLISMGNRPPLVPVSIRIRPEPPGVQAQPRVGRYI